MRITALILFLFISSTFTISQSAWTRVTPRPQENHINDVTKIPGTDKIIAVSDGSTVMISDDGGESWQMILNPGGLANDYPLNTVYFYNSLVGFIGGHYYEFMNIQDYILKTEDGGITWQVNNNLPTGTYVYDFYFVNQNTGFVAGYNNLLKTTDGGQNWFEVETNATFHLNSIDFCNDSTGYIVGDSYESILKTTDYGNTWSEVLFTSPLTEGELRRIQFIDN
ncbi:MAG: hypothetical protein K8R68_12020, partial [Bacteroidales bacterium]|nr:hypothetical protein [Bacteroidales bacterium]